jgi:hypothetical protein
MKVFKTSTKHLDQQPEAASELAARRGMALLPTIELSHLQDA